MIGAIITILGGILAASGFIIKRRPDAQQMAEAEPQPSVGEVEVAQAPVSATYASISDRIRVRNDREKQKIIDLGIARAKTLSASARRLERDTNQMNRAMRDERAHLSMDVVGDAMFDMLRPTGSRLYEDGDEMRRSVEKIRASGAKTIWVGHGNPIPNN